MLKHIKKYGNTNVIVITADEMMIYKLKEGDPLVVYPVKRLNGRRKN